MQRTSAFLAAALAFAGAAAAQTVTPLGNTPPRAVPLPMFATGRTQAQDMDVLLRQWPGTYFETAFEGTEAAFRTGPGRVALSVTVDGAAPIRLPDPAPGVYHVAGFPPGAHRLRVQVVGESQGAPSGFGGFLAPPGTRALPLERRARQIEFVGDSHTVGYANRSAKRDCTEAEVAASTDTAAGVVGLLAGRYAADYQVNAISGRGVVRNYNGGAGTTVPEAYPFALFDRAKAVADAGWRPRLIVVALGTNDFSTPLNSGERWKSRADLHADFERRYADFLRALRARNPQAYLLVWATDIADGEIEAEARAAVARLTAAGEGRIGFAPMHGLTLAACHAHPDLADDATIAAALARHVDGHPDIWAERK